MPYKKTDSYGGPGGNNFSDDLTQTVRISAITVRHGRYIDAISTTWMLTDGKFFTGPRHGGSGGEETTINFSPDEFITSIVVSSGKFIDSLTFITNKKSYGPYGGKGGTPKPVSALNCGGFCGKSGTYLDSISFFIPASQVTNSNNEVTEKIDATA